MEKNCCAKCKNTPRTAEESKNLTFRLNRAIGQLNGIKKMIAENRYCGDILIQLAATEKAIKSLASTILETHMKTCVIEQIQKGDLSVADEVAALFKRF